MRAEQRREIGARNNQWGIEAENIAYEYFIKEGYTCRERNWKCAKLEIDLVLQQGRTIVFVEVKARAAETQDPVDAVNSKKRINLVRAADIYMAELDQLYQYRFDIVTVTGSAENYKFQHYPDAFLPPVNGCR